VVDFIEKEIPQESLIPTQRTKKLFQGFSVLKVSSFNMEIGWKLLTKLNEGSIVAH